MKAGTILKSTKRLKNNRKILTKGQFIN